MPGKDDGDDDADTKTSTKAVEGDDNSDGGLIRLAKESS